MYDAGKGFKFRRRAARNTGGGIAVQFSPMKPKNVVLASWAVVALAVAAVAQDMELQKRTIQLNSDLTAQVISVARDNTGRNLSASIKISNTGQKTLFVLFIGKPAVMDDEGGQQFSVMDVNGVAYCDWSPDRICVGIPDVGRAVPLNSYTEVDAGRSITVLMTFRLFHADPSTSGHVSLSTEIAYRIVESAASDAELNERQKLKDVHIGNLSFDSVKVREK